MSYSLIDLRKSIKNLIDKNNVTASSYFISSNLYRQVQSVVAGYSKMGALNIEYPLIWVELKSDNESFNQLGRTSRRDLNVTFDIVAEVDYGVGQYDGRDVSDTEMIRLGQNLKDLFRSFPTCSGTVDMLTVSNTQYDIERNNDDTYNSVVRLTIECFKSIS